MNVAIRPVKDDKEQTMMEIKEAVSNIKATLKIQARKGIKDAQWILNHL